jgi:CHAT domain-containing protein
VLAAWRAASHIHVAAHLVRDPRFPFSPFVPLARDTSGEPRDDYIEIADVRGLDLSGCELAVISTCSSGAPYAESGRMGPSFGDAFVDAGARCVVQAAWAVEDARAAPFMERFLAELRIARDPVRALGAARRAAIRGELGPPNPRDWAAWSASVAPPWAGAEPPGEPAVALRSSP